MNLQQLYLIGGILFIFIFLLIIFLINRKQILSFFYPSNYVIIEMLELDNNVRQWIEKKNDNLRFEFNKGYYNMFNQSLEEHKHKNGEVLYKTIKSPAIYREGRLAKFFYHEGHEDPIDYRAGKISGNPQINKQYEELQFSDLWAEDSLTIEDFFKKYGFYIMIILIIVVIWLIVRKPEQAVQIVKGG